MHITATIHAKVNSPRTRTLIRRCAQKKGRRFTPLLPKEEGNGLLNVDADQVATIGALQSSNGAQREQTRTRRNLNERSVKQASCCNSWLPSTRGQKSAGHDGGALCKHANSHCLPRSPLQGAPPQLSRRRRRHRSVSASASAHRRR